MLLTTQSEESIMDPDIYIAHLYRKFEERPNISQLCVFDFSYSPADLDSLKSQFMEELKNKPIELPLESEDAKSRKHFPAGKELKRRIAMQQGEESIEQSDDSKLDLDVPEPGDSLFEENTNSKQNTKKIQYAACNNMIIVKSRRAELVLVKHPSPSPQDGIHHCPSSSTNCSGGDDDTSSSSSFKDDSFTNQDNNGGGDDGRSTENEDSSSSAQESSDDGSEDEGNESDDEEGHGNAASDLIISPTSTQESIVYSYSKLTDHERMLLEHFEHAHVCQQRADQQNVCAFPNCSDPGQIVAFCNKVLTELPYADDQVHEECSRALIHHALHCSSQCNMMLCQHFEAIQTELSMATHRSDVQDNYQVVLSKVPSIISGEMTEGVDFSLSFVDLRGRGAFGEVINGCFNSHCTKKAHVAVKKIVRRNNASEAVLKHSLSCLSRLGSHPNLLLPDLVLSCSTHYLFVMECADISLLEYTRQVFEELQPEEDVNKRQQTILQLCCYYFYEMAKGVQYCHESRFVHGDIKPGNAVLSSNFRVLKLIDWDFLREEERQVHGGTKGYAAPEISHNGVVSRSSDVFSLCRSLHLLLNGREKELVLEDAQDHLGPSISVMNHDLGQIYKQGTLIDPVQRITANEIVAEFEANDELKELRSSYLPVTINRLTGAESDASKCFHFYRNWLLKKLTQTIEPLYEEEEEMDID